MNHSTNWLERRLAALTKRAKLQYDYPYLSQDKLQRDFDQVFSSHKKLAEKLKQTSVELASIENELKAFEAQRAQPTLHEVQEELRACLKQLQEKHRDLVELGRLNAKNRNRLALIKQIVQVQQFDVVAGLATLTQKTLTLQKQISDLTSLGVQLSEGFSQLVELSEWNKRVIEPRHQIAAGFAEVGARALFEIAYGVDAPKATRKAAILEMIKWAKSIDRVGLTKLLNDHLNWLKSRRSLERVENLNFIQYESSRRSAKTQEPGEEYFVLLESLRLDAGDQTADNLLWIANFVAKLEKTIFGANLEHQVQLAWINKSLEASGLARLTLEAGDEPALDRIQAHASQKLVDGDAPLISVIMPVFNAEKWISTAINSLRNQTWSNLEILVVDDCSSDSTYSIAKTFEAIDSRVQVSRAETNSGPYHCRNLALRRAKGEFVTVHDGDDWSHPEKIELQARHLLENPTVIANVSEGARLDESDLITGVVGRTQILRPNFSSLMFRRQQVAEQLGFWDEVRFGGDSEFQNRLVACFGEDAFVQLRSGCLSLLRAVEGSLTSGGLQEVLSGARRLYKDSFLKWHQDLLELQDSFYLDPSKARRFFAPRASLNNSEVDRSFNLLVISDFSRQFDKNDGLRLLLQRAQESGKRIIISHVPALTALTSTPARAVETFCLERGIEMAWHVASELHPNEKITSDVLVATDSAVAVRFDKLPPFHAANHLVLVEKPTELSRAQISSISRNFRAMFGESPVLIHSAVELQEKLEIGPKFDLAEFERKFAGITEESDSDSA